MGVFAKARYQRAGAVSAKSLGGGMRYYTWRGREKHDGRDWETGDGRVLSYKQARAEIEDYCREHPERYMYTAVAGTKREELESGRYRQELSRDFDRVYYVRHHDQHEGDDKHPHAHVIAFRDKTFKKAELSDINKRWQEVDRDLEHRREQERERERADRERAERERRDQDLRRAERDRREAERRRDPVERRAQVWRGIGYSWETARALATWERDRGKEFRTDGEARKELEKERDAMYRQKWSLREERREHGRLEEYARQYRQASEVVERSSGLRRMFSADARSEYERASRTMEWAGDGLTRARVEGYEDLERRGEELGRREAEQGVREEAWRPYEKAWQELGNVMRAREEEHRQELKKRKWDMLDRLRGDPPGTAKARDEMDRGDEWGR